MNKKLLSILILIFSISYISSQDYCRISMDSVVSGQNATAYSVYYYNDDVKIEVVESTDSNSVNVNYIDSAFYDVEGRLSDVKKYETWTGSNYENITVSYGLGNRVSRVDESGTNGSGGWTRSYDFSYNSSNELESMLLDSTSLSGQPGGMEGNWKNILWNNGNIVSLTLEADFIGGGPIDIDLNVTTDTINNLARLRLVSESIDYIFRLNKNNTTNVATAVLMTIPGVIFPIPAGTSLMQMVYSPNSYNEAIEEEILPNLFLGTEGSTRELTLDCSISNSIIEMEKSEVSIYPNPVSNMLYIKNFDNTARVIIYDVSGKQIFKIEKVNITEIEVSDLPQGIYICDIKSESKSERIKFIKE